MLSKRQSTPPWTRTVSCDSHISHACHPALCESRSVSPHRLGHSDGLADVIREIDAEPAPRGFPGRSAENMRAEDEARLVEDAERDGELDAARRGPSSGGA